ncbi:very short patch repair endonuclease [Bacillus sp. FJAT-27251]|uniref:very short patch repair endonuclease n=1 Tax=Bacillus sp. FJAT-27251 TaxID=1684142 RepID=UPI0006A7A47F|nr:very short patch repair endonuclease [Bacillus sp. FJAT-27251]
MAEKISKEQRSKNMRAIRSVSKLENEVSKALWKKGFRFRKNTNMFGKPDISIKKYKIVIFIDSCFWHSCSIHGNMPKTNQQYWLKKLERNKLRDEEVTRFYLDKGWKVLRVWEHDLKLEFDSTVNRIDQFLKKAILS